MDLHSPVDATYVQHVHHLVPQPERLVLKAMPDSHNTCVLQEQGVRAGQAHKAEVAAGADLQDEAEVDVDQVARLVDHDVAVVPVLDVQQVARNCIPAEAR